MKRYNMIRETIDGETAHMSECGEGEWIRYEVASAIVEAARQATYEAQRANEQLLADAARLLEYASFHDGRYSQATNEDWISATVKWSKRAESTSGRKRYSDMWRPEKGE